MTEAKLDFTPVALNMIKTLLEEESETGIALRIAITGKSRDDFDYAIGFVYEDEKDDTDFVQDIGVLSVLVDAESISSLNRATVDYVTEDEQTGFKISNPNPLWNDPLEEKVHQVLIDKVGPGVAAHGGTVDLVKIEDDVVYVQFGGGCQGCGMANVTLKQGVEVMIKYEVPEIARVVDITEHEKGENPFFQSNSPSQP